MRKLRLITSGLLLSLLLGLLLCSGTGALAFTGMLWVELDEPLKQKFEIQAWDECAPARCKHGKYEQHQWNSVLLYGTPITGPGPYCGIMIIEKDIYAEPRRFAVFQVGVTGQLAKMPATPWFEYVEGNMTLESPRIEKLTLGGIGARLAWFKIASEKDVGAKAKD